MLRCSIKYASKPMFAWIVEGISIEFLDEFLRWISE